jgi:hypothetical protein
LPTYKCDEDLNQRYRDTPVSPNHQQSPMEISPVSGGPDRIKWFDNQRLPDFI